MLDSYKQDSNTAAFLSNPTYDEESGNITLDYQDEDGNLPIKKFLLICPYDELDSDECVEFTMYPITHSYQEGTTFFTNISNKLPFNIASSYCNRIIFFLNILNPNHNLGNLL